MLLPVKKFYISTMVALFPSLLLFIPGGSSNDLSKSLLAKSQVDSPPSLIYFLKAR